MLQVNDLLKLQNGSDIRGVAMEDGSGEPVRLTAAAAASITAAFTHWLAQKMGRPARELTIAIGNDSRLTAEALRQETLSAVLSTGARALDCGMASTPAMFMALLFDETKADGSIMLTASHLPANRNGMKFFTPQGGLGKEDIRAILLAAAEEHLNTVESAPRGCALITRYARFLRDKIVEGIGDGPKPLRDMHIVVDAGNGAGGFFATEVLAPLGADISGSRFLEPDGHFPNHVPNPEDKTAMAAIRAAVTESHADLGLIFDTDVDRMSAVLADGSEIGRNALIAMMAAILAPDYPGSTIVTDSVTSDELTVFLEKELGLRHHRFRRGYKNVIDESRRLNNAGTVSPLAIETSGHGALSENYFLDDGAYLAVKLIIAAARQQKAGRSLGSLIEALAYPEESREYRLVILGVDDPQAYGETILGQLAQRAEAEGISIASPSYEGVRLVFPDGWALLRMSLHDPNMPLNIEGRKKGSVQAIAGKIRSFLADASNLDLSPLP